MANSNNFNYISLFKDLGTACMTEATCGKCMERECLIGYGKDCVSTCYKNDTNYVQDGCENIPYLDTKGGYDEVDIMNGIAHVLNQCRSCKENHNDGCILNVVRGCYETILFGEHQPFNGIAFSYLMKLQEKDPAKAAAILEEYKKSNC